MLCDVCNCQHQYLDSGVSSLAISRLLVLFSLRLRTSGKSGAVSFFFSSSFSLLGVLLPALVTTGLEGVGCCLRTSTMTSVKRWLI